jgi:hypothetical protein
MEVKEDVGGDRRALVVQRREDIRRVSVQRVSKRRGCGTAHI